MINLFSKKDKVFKKQIEFLLGKKVKLKEEEIQSLAHCTVGNLWVIKVLDKLGLTIDDIIYEQDRNVLRQELKITTIKNKLFSLAAQNQTEDLKDNLEYWDEVIDKIRNCNDEIGLLQIAQMNFGVVSLSEIYFL